MASLQAPFASDIQLRFYQRDVPTEDLTQEANCMLVARAVQRQHVLWPAVGTAEGGAGFLGW